jgi:hypothetical protein
MNQPRMGAWRQPDGWFALSDIDRKASYFRREEIKRNGGRWNPDKKRWYVPESALAPLDTDRRIEVMCVCQLDSTYRHSDLVWERDAVVGRSIRPSNCGRCFNENYDVIVEVLGVATQWGTGIRASHVAPDGFTATTDGQAAVAEAERILAGNRP